MCANGQMSQFDPGKVPGCSRQSFTRKLPTARAACPNRARGCQLLVGKRASSSSIKIDNSARSRSTTQRLERTSLRSLRFAKRMACPTLDERLRIAHSSCLSGMSTHAGCAELPAGATPVRLMQKRDAMSIDQVLTTLGGARPLLYWPDVEWTGHPESMPACVPGFGAAAHGQRGRQSHAEPWRPWGRTLVINHLLRASVAEHPHRAGPSRAGHAKVPHSLVIGPPAKRHRYRQVLSAPIPTTPPHPARRFT